MSKPQQDPFIFLTKYERARVLGVRSLQISNGAIPMVVVDKDMTDSMEIAIKELREYKTPLCVRRKYPDGSYIDIKVSDMIN